MISTKTDDELIKQFIEKDPYHPGPADMRVKDHHIHVWALVGSLQNCDFNVDEVARSYDIPAEYVHAALAYYRRHSAVINGRLADNELNESEPIETDDPLVRQLIERDPYHPGPGDVRIKDHNIHVWALVGALKNYNCDLEPVAAEYDIPVKYVRAALAYYRENPEVIEGRLAANDAD